MSIVSYHKTSNGFDLKVGYQISYKKLGLELAILLVVVAVPVMYFFNPLGGEGSLTGPNGQSAENLEIRIQGELDAGEFASVKVTNQEGKPVEGAQIYVNEEPEGVTNAAGQYTVPISSSWTEVEFRVTKGNSTGTLTKEITSVSSPADGDGPDLDGSVSLSVDAPDSQSISENLEVSWTSTNNYDMNHRLISSTVTVESGGTEVEREINRGDSYENGESTDEEVVFTGSDLSDLGGGTWTVEVEDRWDHDIGTATAEISVTEPDFFVDMVSPESDNSYVIGDNFELEVSTQVQSDADQTVETSITIEDESGNTASEELAKTVSESEKTSFTKNFVTSELESLTVGDEWTVTATAEGTQTGSNSAESVQISTRQPEEDPEGSVSMDIVNPDSSITHDIGNDSLDLQWNSVNDYNTENTLTETEVSITDGSGGSYTNTFSYAEQVSSNASSTNQEIISSDAIELSSLTEGDWTIELTDNWEYGSSTSSVTITAEGGSSDDTVEEDDSSGNEQEQPNFFIQSPSDGDSLEGPVVSYSVNIDNVDNSNSRYELVKDQEVIDEGNLTSKSNSIDEEIMTNTSGSQDFFVRVIDNYWNEEYTSNAVTFSTDRKRGDFVDVDMYSPREGSFTSNNDVTFEITFNEVLDDIDSKLYINGELTAESVIESGSSSHTETETLTNGEHTYHFILESQSTPERLNSTLRTFEIGNDDTGDPQ